MSIPEQQAGGFVSDLDRIPQRNVLADEVYEILRQSLLTRRIEPGARLNMDNLARELHVSNTPIRQALARLESDGLVTKEPYRGFAASPLLDSRAVAELYDYRMLIEPVSAARAARRQRSDAVAELDRLCDEHEIARMIDDPAAAEALGDRDMDFHCRIAAEAGNTYVLENIRATLIRMSRFTMYPRQGAGALAWVEHRAVTEAIRAGNPDEAANAMRTHLATGLERITSAIH